MTLRLSLATGAVLLVAAAAAAAAGNPVQGTFRTVIANAPAKQLDGTWQIAFQPTGRYSIKLNGTVLISGRDTQTATTIGFGHESGPAACTGAEASATYRWSMSGGSLHLTPVREPCEGRRVVLTTHPLTRVG